MKSTHETGANDDITKRLVRSMEADVIRGLMAGNDAQCFSLEQYVEARDKWIFNITRLTRQDLGIDETENDRYWLFEYARRQLRACSLVVEVEPDVWTLESLMADISSNTGAL